jgi:hypothetical protein
MSYRELSEHRAFANQTLPWFSTDNERYFNYYLRMRYDDLDKLGWLYRKVSYTFNSLGFRCDEINSTNDSVVFLGGSEAIGRMCVLWAVISKEPTVNLKVLCRS